MYKVERCLLWFLGGYVVAQAFGVVIALFIMIVLVLLFWQNTNNNAEGL